MKNFLTILSLVFLIASCGKDNPQSELAGSKDQVIRTAIEGNWEGDCFPLGPQQSAKGFVLVRGSLLNYTLQHHQGLDCNNAVYNLTWFSTFEVRENNNETPKEGQVEHEKKKLSQVYEIDFVLQTIVGLVHTEEAARDLSGKTFCGYNDWDTQSAKEVTGRKCDDNQLASKGFEAFDLLRLEEEKLYFSPWTYGAVPADRPRETGLQFFTPMQID